METETVKRKYDHLPLGISGLGGWLVLVQIGLWLTVVINLVQLFQMNLQAFAPDIWNELTSSDSEFYHPLWGPVIIFEAVYNVLFLVFTVFVIVCFLRKLSIVPRLMIIFYSMSFLIGVIDTLLIYQIPLAKEASDGSEITDSVRSLITCLIWIPYFLRSERVRNTFVR